MNILYPVEPYIQLDQRHIVQLSNAKIVAFEILNFALVGKEFHKNTVHVFSPVCALYCTEGIFFPYFYEYAGSQLG